MYTITNENAAKIADSRKEEVGDGGGDEGALFTREKTDFFFEFRIKSNSFIGRSEIRC